MINFEQITSEFESAQLCYTLLQDQKSRDLFFHRVCMDLMCSFDSFYNLSRGSDILSLDQLKKNFDWVFMLQKTQKPVIIYGAGNWGKKWFRMLKNMGINIKGFCDKNCIEINKKMSQIRTVGTGGGWQ